MRHGTERFLLFLALVIILAGAWFKPLEIVATQQIDAGLKRALVSFATARALNAIISVAQGTELAIEPGGVGVKLAPGQILRPINDLVEQFAELMLAASVAFGVTKVLISIGSYWVVSLLLSAFALGWIWFRWRGRDSPVWLARVLFVLLFLCALICAQTASFASEHSHHHASRHCCRLCHVGPLPLLEPVTSAGGGPIMAVAWLPLSRDFDTPHEALLTAGSSRAPPFSLPV